MNLPELVVTYPAGAESNRYVKLWRQNGWPNDFFYTKEDAETFADLNGVSHNVYPTVFRET